MFILGHLGIGYELTCKIQGNRRPLLFPFLIGALLPDIIDKSVYYFLVWKTGVYGDALGLISCTRTFGHTLLFALCMLALTRWVPLEKTAWKNLVVGIFSHLAIDMAHDLIVHPKDYSAWIAFFFPSQGFHFASGNIPNPIEHGLRILKPVIFIPELLGALLLYRNWRKKS